MFGGDSCPSLDVQEQRDCVESGKQHEHCAHRRTHDKRQNEADEEQRVPSNGQESFALTCDEVPPFHGRRF